VRSSPSAAAAHDPELMRATLQRHLQASAGASFQIRDCRVTNTRRRDGTRGATQYELHIEDSSTGRLWNQIVTGITFGGDRTRRVWESIRETATARNDVAAGPDMPNFFLRSRARSVAASVST
jgi:hypothetical protein